MRHRSFAAAPRARSHLLRAVIGGLLLIPLAAFAQTQPAADPARLEALYNDGKRAEALALAQERLQAKPNDITALTIAALVLQEQDKPAEAIPLGERLVKVTPGSQIGWQLLVQLYQAVGDPDSRNGALRELIEAQKTAMSRSMRDRPFILRDRISQDGRVLMARENFDTGAGDFAKYLFIPVQELAAPRNYLVLTSDEGMTADWREAGMLGPDKRLFHLDNIYEGPDGTQGRAVYVIYPDLPSYDVVRAKVLEILGGKVKPASGKPGGLAVPKAG